MPQRYNQGPVFMLKYYYILKYDAYKLYTNPTNIQI